MSTTQDLVAQLWARFQPLALERVELIASYLDGADPTDRAAAERAAHDLVGSLGSYGRPQGSVLAARLDALLGAGADPMDIAARDEGQALVARLRAEVDR